MDFFNKAKGFVSRGLMGAGGALRKFGETGAPIIRKIGQTASLLRPAVTAGGLALAPITGGASLGVAGLVNKGLGYASQLAGKAQPIAEKIGQFGGTLQQYGRALQ